MEKDVKTSEDNSLKLKNFILEPLGTKRRDNGHFFEEYRIIHVPTNECFIEFACSSNGEIYFHTLGVISISVLNFLLPLMESRRLTPISKPIAISSIKRRLYKYPKIKEKKKNK